MDLLEWLIHGTIPVPGDGALGAREVIGNVFGLASAILGMRRLVWAWPIGLDRQRPALHRLRHR